MLPPKRLGFALGQLPGYSRASPWRPGCPWAAGPGLLTPFQCPRLSMGYGARLLRPSQCPVLQPCAAALSTTIRTRQRYCSKREWEDAAPGPPTAMGHNPALLLAGGIKTGDCIKHHRPPATYKISFQIFFQSHCASVLTLSSNTLSPHISQTDLWVVITPL